MLHGTMNIIIDTHTFGSMNDGLHELLHTIGVKNGIVNSIIRRIIVNNSSIRGAVFLMRSNDRKIGSLRFYFVHCEPGVIINVIALVRLDKAILDSRYTNH